MTTTYVFDDYSDAELSQHLNDVINEQERRANLSRIPGQMAEMQATYVRGGGDLEALAEALAAPLPAQEPEQAPESTESVDEPPEGA